MLQTQDESSLSNSESSSSLVSYKLIQIAMHTQIMLCKTSVNLLLNSDTHSLTKEGPWAVHLTFGSNGGVGQHSRHQCCVVLNVQNSAYCGGLVDDP